jgi:hypothetical protein
MGRPGGCNCCGEPTLQTPCYDHSSKSHYKVGGGGWKTDSALAEYQYEKGNSVYHGLTAIKHVQKRSSYGEYSASVYPVLYGKEVQLRFGGGYYEREVYVSSSVAVPTGSLSDYSSQELNDLYQSGDSDVGLVLPSLWTVTIGSGDEIITVVRKVRASSRVITVNKGSKDFLNPPKDYYCTISDYLVQYKGETIFASETPKAYKMVTRWDLLYERGVPTTTNFASAGSTADDGGVSYCLTYPFFKLTHGATNTYVGNSAFTHYFDSAASCDFIGPPEGTIDLPIPPPFYHADKSLFGGISVEAGDFIVFNPYSTNGLGRAATPSDFEGWIPQVCDEEYVNSGPGYGDGYYGPRRSVDDCSAIRTTYIDNKLDGTSIPKPQKLGGIQNEPIGQTVTFPVGFPGDYDPILSGGSVDFFRKYMTKNGLWEDNVGTATQYVDNIIFVLFRSERGADKAAMDTEVDMSAYHPVGSVDKYTIAEIVERGANLKPIKVKISNGPFEKTVDISEIELEEDIFSYAMNGRTYYLQTLYLKSLGGDFHNPLKYRVSRIDLVNPDIDIDCIESEISGSPKMVDIEVGAKVLYPIGQVDENGDEIVPDEYTVSEIVEPTKVRLSNPLADADGDVVDVSEIELINPNENPTYIELTDTELRSGLRENAKGMQTCLKLFEDGNNISLEFGDFLPRMRDAQLTATSYLQFQLRVDQSRERVFSDERKTGDSWVMLSGNTPENSSGRKMGETHKLGVSGRAITDQLEWKQSQLPKNGYFFGHDLGLKFYIEDIEEWKKQHR